MKVFHRLGSSRVDESETTVRRKRRKKSSGPKRSAAKRARTKSGRFTKKRKASRKPRSSDIHAGLRKPGPARFPIRTNPIHLPRTARGRPAATRYWLLDVYSGNHITTYIGHANRTDAERDAQRILTQKRAEKVALCGPYARQPSLSSPRK